MCLMVFRIGSPALQTKHILQFVIIVVLLLECLKQGQMLKKHSRKSGHLIMKTTITMKQLLYVFGQGALMPLHFEFHLKCFLILQTS